MVKEDHSGGRLERRMSRDQGTHKAEHGVHRAEHGAHKVEHSAHKPEHGAHKQGHAHGRRMSVIGKDSHGHKLKGRGKNQAGTPEKAGTPSQEGIDENQSPTRNVIWNEEIEKLQIKEDYLKTLHEGPVPTAPKTPKSTRVTVRKMKPASEWDKPKPKIVTVARPAPVDAPIKEPDYSGFAGPRYDEDGAPIPHSLLGSYEEFRKEAIKRGDLLDLPVSREGDVQPDKPTLKYEKKRRHRPEPLQPNENNALINWQMKMMERKRQQGYISKLLQKNPEDLAMNAADNYRRIQEERYIIDRSIPFIDYGKGYRVGSEFWKQQERFGDEETGIHMTLTKSEQGYPPPVEHIGVPKAIRNEKGWNWPPYHTTPVHYPWHKNPYLEERKNQLKEVISELDPHRPEFDKLEIIGTANPVNHERVQSNLGMVEDEERLTDGGLDMDYIEPPQEINDKDESKDEAVFGPSISFAGQPARWTGDSHSYADQIGIEARVTFESLAGDRVTSYLYIVNDGTTAVYYDWKRLPRENPFDLVHARVQRFYFNNSSGVILPGETMKFPFVFKSPNAGVFSEQWKFETRPSLCGGAALIVTLRGIALQEDKFQKEREELERDLQQKQAEQVARQILYDIISGIKSPDRPSSPIDAYITDEEIFHRNNPKLHYNHTLVGELKQLYLEIAPEEDREGRVWDLSVEDLKDEIVAMDEDDERKENFLHQLNIIISKMSFCPNKPVKKDLYKVGYELLVEAVDSIVRESYAIRHTMGLPERENDDLPDDFNASPESRLSNRRQPSRLSNADSDVSDTRSKSKAENKGAKAPPEKKPPPPKDAKAAKGKEAKPDPKAKSTPSAKKPAGSRGPSVTPGPPASTVPPERERTHSPLSPVPSGGEDSPQEKAYKQKLTAQAYLIMDETFRRVGEVFDNISATEDAKPLML
ncbi:MYCBP-associated protein-like isoform X2 [Saccostrea echinata]|uniref:MYCBP-associated protein-like isoform X2 n=1 Tax=Saccostrea echinata TaxID=191078 RepID=UPI002A839618|nr:MYCBP-associated protein-like isoform X2 [Saccostrea echinata]